MNIKLSITGFSLILFSICACNHIHEKPDQKNSNINNAITGHVVVPGYKETRDDFYAGNESCKACHLIIFDRWSLTSHASPRSVTKHTNPPHTGNCKRCHTQPTIGCEACHGPSGTHANQPQSSIKPECLSCDIQKQCILCHTRSVDERFDLRSAIKQVDHGADIKE